MSKKAKGKTKPEDLGRMRLVSLGIENYKRVKAISLVPDKYLQEIAGENATGKSSTLDAVQVLLDGLRCAPEIPIHHGETEAHIAGDFGALQITRDFTEDGKSKLVVVGPDGTEEDAPQSLLNKLKGPINFDPLAFDRMRPKDQVSAILPYVDLKGFDLVLHDAMRVKLYDQRTDVGRDLKRAKGALEDAGDEPDEAPAQVDVTETSRELEAILTARAEDDARVEKIDMLRMEIEGLEKRVEMLKAKRLELVTEHKAAPMNGDPESLRVQITEAGEKNERAYDQRRRHEDWHRLASEVDAYTKRYGALTAKIDGIDEAKAAALAKAEWPVEGMGIEGEHVTYLGVRLADASQAERYRVALGVAMSPDPIFRVLLIPNAAVLGQKYMGIFHSMAVEHDYQILMERQLPTPLGEGAIVIEDGGVRVLEEVQDG